MKKRAFQVFTVFLVYTLTLSLSAVLPSAVSSLRPLVSYLPPILLSLVFLRDKPEHADSDAPEAFFPCHLPLPFADLPLLLPLVCPVLALIVGTAFLSQTVGIALGLAPSPSLSGSFAPLFFGHALLPALAEEWLFRFVSLRLLANRNRLTAIFAPSLYFALLHGSPVNFSYALVAGILFAALDLAFSSLLPSLLIHLLSNTFSLVWMLSGGTAAFRIFLILLAVLTLCSVCILIRKRKTYASHFRSLLKIPSPKGADR